MKLGHEYTGLGFIISHQLREYKVKKLRYLACCRQKNAIFHLIFTQPMGSNKSQPSTPIAAGAHLVCMKHEPSMTSECSSRGPVSSLASEFNKPVYMRRFPLKTGFSCVPFPALRRQNENQNRLRWSDQMSVSC